MPGERYSAQAGLNYAFDGLIRSIDEPNKDIDAIWAEEAEKRLIAHHEGKTAGIVFKMFSEKNYNNADCL